MVDVNPGSLRLSVPADASTLSGHIAGVRVFLLEHDVDRDTTDDVRLCVHECCANAIRHSGSTDEIEVWLTVHENDVTMLVSDSGCGIDLGRCDPRRPPEPQSTCGRGLYLVAQLMDEFEISVDGGTEIRMTKRLPKPEL
jgi:anti-sigma regulatory factor (Ser/Thr protein kinase)